jgi:hypothetical protein
MHMFVYVVDDDWETSDAPGLSLTSTRFGSQSILYPLYFIDPAGWASGTYTPVKTSYAENFLVVAVTQ